MKEQSYWIPFANASEHTSELFYLSNREARVFIHYMSSVTGGGYFPGAFIPWPLCRIKHAIEGIGHCICSKKPLVYTKEIVNTKGKKTGL